MLSIGVDQSRMITHTQNLCSIVGIFAAFVQLKLNPKEPGTIAEEDGRGLVIVIVDGFPFPLTGLVAVPAQGIVLVVVDISLVKQSAAAIAVGVVVLISTATQGNIICSVVIFP